MLRRGRWRLRAVYKPLPAYLPPSIAPFLLTNQTNQTLSNGRARVAAAGGRQGVHAAPPPQPRAGRAPGIRARLPPLLRRPPPPRRSPRSARMHPSTHVTGIHFVNGVERMSVERLCLNWVGDCRGAPGTRAGCCSIGCCGLQHVRGWWLEGIRKSFTP